MGKFTVPGVFFLKERKIVRAFRHRMIGDEPDDLNLVGASKKGNVSHRSVKEVSASTRSSSRECDLLSPLFFSSLPAFQASISSLT